MAYVPEKATRTQWEAIQHALGFNLADVAGLVGPALSAAWLWTAGEPLQPRETPVRWLGRMTDSVGLSDR